MRPVLNSIGWRERLAGLRGEPSTSTCAASTNRWPRCGRPPATACRAYLVLVCESARRTLGQRLFDEQIVAGLAMAHGAVVEMHTGEGKTLAATLPVAL